MWIRVCGWRCICLLVLDESFRLLSAVLFFNCDDGCVDGNRMRLMRRRRYRSQGFPRLRAHTWMRSFHWACKGSKQWVERSCWYIRWLPSCSYWLSHPWYRFSPSSAFLVPFLSTTNNIYDINTTLYWRTWNTLHLHIRKTNTNDTILRINYRFCTILLSFYARVLDDFPCVLAMDE